MHIKMHNKVKKGNTQKSTHEIARKREKNRGNKRKICKILEMYFYRKVKKCLLLHKKEY